MRGGSSFTLPPKSMPSSPQNAGDLKKSASAASKPAATRRRFLPLSLRRTAKGWQVQVQWPRLGVFAVILLLLGWLGLAGAGYLFVKYQRGFTDVKFTDILFVRRQAYRTSSGDFFIKTAKAQMKADDLANAFMSLKIGVSKNPANKEGRILLAQFYAALWHRPDIAQKTLLEGLPYQGNDTGYLQLLFSFLLQREEDARVIEVCKNLLGNDRSLTPRNQLIATAAASACYFRGNYDQAEDFMNAYGLQGTREGRLLVARITWERGSKDKALDQLNQLASEFPADEEIYSQIVSYLRAAGRYNDARRTSLLRSIAYPADARARIDLLYALHKEGDSDAVRSNAADIFQDFPDSSEAMLALADFAANTGDTALAQKIYDYTKTRKLDADGTALMLVESNIVAKKYQDALNLVGNLLKTNPDWAKRYYVVLNGLQAIATYGLGDPNSAQLFLNNILMRSDVRADNLIAISKRLIEVGARTQARQVLAQAVKTDPLNQAALTGLVQLDLDLDNTDTLAANIRTLMTMRKPPKELLLLAYRKLGGDLFLFAPGRVALLQDLRATIAASPAGS